MDDAALDSFARDAFVFVARRFTREVGRMTTRFVSLSTTRGAQWRVDRGKLKLAFGDDYVFECVEAKSKASVARPPPTVTPPALRCRPRDRCRSGPPRGRCAEAPRGQAAVGQEGRHHHRRRGQDLARRAVCARHLHRAAANASGGGAGGRSFSAAGAAHRSATRADHAPGVGRCQPAHDIGSGAGVCRPPLRV